MLHSSYLSRKLSLFFSISLTIFALTGFILHAYAGTNQFPVITISSPTTNGSTYKTASDFVPVGGGVIISAPNTISKLIVETNVSGDINNVNKVRADVTPNGLGSSTVPFMANVQLVDPNVASVLVTFIANDDRAHSASFTIVRDTTPPPVTPTSTTCTVTGTIKNASTNAALGGANILVAAPNSVSSTATSSSVPASLGTYTTRITTTVGALITASAGLNGFMDSTKQADTAATVVPCTKIIDLSLYPNGGTTPGGTAQAVTVSLSGKVKSVIGTDFTKFTGMPNIYVTIGTRRAAVASATDGSYSVSGIQAHVGDLLPVSVDPLNGYTLVGPVYLSIIDTRTTFASFDVFMRPPSTTVTGSVKKQYGSTVEWFQGAHVTLNCSNYSSTATTSGNFGQYAFPFVPATSTSCEVFAQVQNSAGQTISDGPDRFPLAPTSSTLGPTLTLDTTASAKIRIDYPALYDSFGRVSATYQPDTTGPRVAFPFTFSQQGGVAQKVLLSKQQSGPVELTGLDSMNPYSVSIAGETSDAPQNFANQQYPPQTGPQPSPHNLKLGSTSDNDLSITLQPKDRNVLGFQVVDLGGTRDKICYKIESPSAVNVAGIRYNWQRSGCIDRAQSAQSGNGTDRLYTFQVEGAQKFIINADGTKAEVPSPSLSLWPFPQMVGIKLWIQDSGHTNISTPAFRTFDFDKYFGSRADKLPMVAASAPDNRPYIISGVAAEETTQVTGSGKSNRSTTVRSPLAGVTIKISDKTTNLVLCNPTSDALGKYTCTLTKTQVQGVSSGELKLDATLDTNHDFVPISILTNRMSQDRETKQDVILTTNTTSTDCENHAKELGMADSNHPNDQVWFCGQKAKAEYTAYSDQNSKYHAIFSSIVDLITTKLRNTHPIGSKITPPELIIKSGDGPLADVLTLEPGSKMVYQGQKWVVIPKFGKVSTGCWPSPQTKDISGDESAIVLNTKLIEAAVAKMTDPTASAAEIANIQSIVAYYFGRLKDFKEGGCKIDGNISMGATAISSVLSTKWKTQMISNSAKTAVTMGIVSPATYGFMSPQGSSVIPTPQVLYASAFDIFTLKNFLPQVNFQARVDALTDQPSKDDIAGLVIFADEDRK